MVDMGPNYFNNKLVTFLAPTPVFVGMALVVVDYYYIFLAFYEDLK